MKSYSFNQVLYSDVNCSWKIDHELLRSSLELPLLVLDEYDRNCVKAIKYGDYSGIDDILTGLLYLFAEEDLKVVLREAKFYKG